MALTAFNTRLGSSQGRISGVLNSSEDYVFVLGDAETGRFHELTHGDYVEVHQSVDVTTINLVRTHLQLDVPASTPAGWQWVAAIRVDDTSYAQATGRPGRQRVLTDLAANVSKLAGMHNVAVRLTLEKV